MANESRTSALVPGMASKKPRGFAMIRLSAAVLATILLFATEATAGDATQGAIRLAQADDQPMVITPQPRGAQLPPPQADPGGPGVPYEPAPGASAPPPGDQATLPPPPTNSNGLGVMRCPLRLLGETASPGAVDD